MIKVLYEDNHLIVVFKPAGILVQGDETGDVCLMDEVKKYLKEKYKKPGNVFLGLLHRLDRPVSGIVLFAKTSKGASRLSEQIRNRTVEKIYHAVVEGSFGFAQDKNEKGTLVNYLKKDEKKNFVEVFDEPVDEALRAELDYEVVESHCEERSDEAIQSPIDTGLPRSLRSLAMTSGATLLRVNLKTGRSHQIRAQLAHIGHSIVGDVKYGSKTKYKDGEIALCATELSFETATTKERKVISIEYDPKNS
ncbi:MAG: RNA pseudouridine synthase [Candidatus Magasanikbacteria bacterium]|nr:RNA pseudouridine synthase [Candidatus Magasanikbacteria bacterium]